MGLIMPIILLIVSGFVFFGYVDPNYKGNASTFNTSDYSTYGINDLKNEVVKYEDVLLSSKEIVSRSKDLVDKKNGISSTNIAGLEKLLPNNVDNVRLIIEISDIASKRGLAIKDISLGDIKQSTQGGSNLGTISFKFTVNSTYQNFLKFLDDLESNLRLIDITDVSFDAKDSGLYDFNITFNTYWLK